MWTSDHAPRRKSTRNKKKNERAMSDSVKSWDAVLLGAPHRVGNAFTDQTELGFPFCAGGQIFFVNHFSIRAAGPYTTDKGRVKTERRQRKVQK